MGNAIRDGNVLGCQRGEAILSRGGDQVCDAGIQWKGRKGQTLACAVVVGAVQLYNVQRELSQEWERQMQAGISVLLRQLMSIVYTMSR